MLKAEAALKQRNPAAVISMERKHSSFPVETESIHS